MVRLIGYLQAGVGVEHLNGANKVQKVCCEIIVAMCIYVFLGGMVCMSLVCLVSFKETPDKYNKTKIIVLKGEGLIFTNFLYMAGYVAFVSSRPWRFLSI